MRATPRPGVSLRDLLPEDEARPVVAGVNPVIHASSNGPSAEAIDPRVTPGGDGSQRPLLVVEKLVKEYPRQGATATLSKLFSRKPPVEAEIFRAVDGISFSVGHGESVGLVGESGCGKSTTSMMVMRLIDKTAGRIMFDGEDIGDIPAECLRAAAAAQEHPDGVPGSDRQPQPALHRGARHRRSDPAARRYQGPRRAARPLRGTGRQVGLPVDLLDRFPHQLSGGQKARVGIARAIALNPELVILDEPTAALDVSVQAVVLNLLQDLKESMGMSYLFVSHDLNVVRLLCDRVIVMRTGRIVEQGPTERVLGDPQDAYTKDLLAAIPHPPLPAH